MIGDLTYEYDKAGNRTKIGGSWARTGMPEPLSTTSYDANNRQLTFGDKTLAYDDNGNLQSITDSNGTTLYSWNARNQLVGMNGPSVSATFVYDGVGRREAKTINGSLTEFLYDGVNPVQETSGATILANILPGLGIDEFLTRTDVVAGVTSNFLADALGSPVAVTDSAGAVQTEYIFEPFGKTTSSGASNSSSYQYTGRENDGTGLYYYRARFYDPSVQRFISEDPIEFSGNDVNLYTYVFNNPIRFKDPLGNAGYDPNAPGAPGVGPISADYRNSRDMSNLLQMLLNMAGMNIHSRLADETNSKRTEFASKIPCGVTVPVVICYNTYLPLGSVTFQLDAYVVPHGNIYCYRSQITGLKGCSCPAYPKY